MGRTLRINFIMPMASLSGGIKSNRLIGEALVRRGHTVNLAFVDQAPPWPGVAQPRKLWRRLVREWKLRGRQRHHLEMSSANLLPVEHMPIRASDVPDADVTIATWWETAEWIKDWPASKGAKAYFIRAYETYAGDAERIKATYRLPYFKIVIATWLERLMAETFDDTNTVLAPNGVDREQFQVPPRAKNDRPTLGMLYHASAPKASQVGFDAMKRVQEQMPEVRLIAFGSHPISKAHDPPAGLSYTLCPAQGDIPKIYASCDCWMICSICEGLAMPGLEAAACRCPLVSTRCGGPEDYIRPGENGYLVEVNDVESLAARALDVLTCSPQRWQAMSDASHKIAQLFDWDQSAAIVERALVKLVDTTRTHEEVRLAG